MPQTPRTFLTAEWRKLIMANYEVPPALLEPYLPLHTELDLFQGQCYVSLVGFLFRNVRIKGFKVPMHVHFEEVNLRFYVRHKGSNGEWKRGVVFISELVPRPALAFVAKTFYGEPYRTMTMRHKWYKAGNRLVTAYRWKQGKAWQKLQVSTEKQGIPIAPGSEEEFITEHYWGYTKLSRGRTSEYEVVHPVWLIYPLISYDISVDFGAIYGAGFSFLTDSRPNSIFLAEGSEIKVQGGLKVQANN